MHRRLLKTFAAPAPWATEVRWRMRRHLLLKLVGTTLWIWAFFIGYFHLLRHVAFPVTIMPLTPLDGVVPITPWAIVPYLSLWFYVGIGPGLQRTFAQLVVYGLWAAVLCGIGLALFHRFPTRIPTFVFDRGGMPGFQLLQGIDSPGNACPSMHVAIAVFSAIRLAGLAREIRTPAWAFVANWAWCAAIVYSTLAIRQHVVIDVLAGAVLGIAVAIPSLRWRPGAPRGRPAIMAATLDERAAIDLGKRTPEDMTGTAR